MIGRTSQRVIDRAIYSASVVERVTHLQLDFGCPDDGTSSVEDDPTTP
jgi:hypothetical protein